ncbi:MAG: hypothetical protein CML19_00750 [Pusillimonas sp.]|jgi:hypothetical protein|nr:hypothetical protein [Pusillimonas sp.]|tara:strand:- start:2920 stop:3351 length:432 start_codon:yes stop_codon:yes gene_type:complete
MKKSREERKERNRSSIEWYKSNDAFDLDTDFDEENDKEIYESLLINKISSPQRVLFISVFLQALLDGTKPETKEESRASKKNRHTSIKWFTVPACVTASTYEPICELAGIEPSYGRKFFTQILNKDIEFVRRRINVLLNNIRD